MSTQRWLELRLVIDRSAVDLASGLLFGLGAEGAQEDWLPGEAPPVRQPWDEGPGPDPLPQRVVLRAWWHEDDKPALEPALRGHDWVRAEPSWSTVEDADWAEAWRAGFHPIHISPTLTVSPPWEASPGDLVIEPGLAFGTGEHPTTRACLAAIERHATPGGRCLDVGTGTGVLALAAVRLGMTALGIDTDPEAVRATLDNAQRNGLQVQAHTTPLAQVSGTWDLVVANVYAEVLTALAPDLLRTCGGSLVLAGILQEKADRVIAALPGLHLAERHQDGEWVCLEFTR